MNDKEVAKKALAELDSAFIDVTIHAQAAFALVRYVRDLEMRLTALQKQITAAARPSRAEVLEEADLSDDELALIREEAATITDDWSERQLIEPTRKESDAKFVREILRLAGDKP